MRHRGGHSTPPSPLGAQGGFCRACTELCPASALSAPRLPQDARGGCLGPSAGHISATATFFQAHSPYN